MGNFDDSERRPPQPVIIEDLRHRRDAEEEEEAEAPEPAAEAPQPAPAGGDASAPSAVHEAAAPEAGPGQRGPAVEGDGSTELTPDELSAAQEAEYAYLMQLFQLGLPGYLRSQLGILLNFALINLGRAANPATGLIGADLDQAKLAIDALEFILARLQASLEPRERTEMLQMLSELKYTFMQAVSAAPSKMPASGGGEA
jgi:hypothetical protein